MTAPALRPLDGDAGAPPRVVATAIVAMARPSQLLLIAAVMLLGVALAAARGAAVEPLAIVVALAVLLPVAASIHLANEYADHETDRLTVRTPFSGGSGALPATGLPRSIALRAAQVAALAGIAGASAAWAAGLLPTPAGAVLVAGLVGGWAYSVGPFALAWRGLGEVANGLLGGMLLPLFGVAVADVALDGYAVASFVPLALLVTANLLATTWPDRVADAAVGKRTLATRWSPARLRALFGLLAVVATAVLVVQGLGAWPTLVVLAGLSAVPFLALGLDWYTRRESPLPTVAAMVWLAIAQLGAWIVVAQA
jgi:1,4-dihydroxy-2-naphthoate octaprenyltransferase